MLLVFIHLWRAPAASRFCSDDSSLNLQYLEFNDDKIYVKTNYLIHQLFNYGIQLLELFFYEINLLYIVLKHVQYR